MEEEHKGVVEGEDVPFCALMSVTPDQITFDMCTRAVCQHGSMLRKVPKKFKTYEMCEMAVKYGGVSALQYVPDRFKTLPMYVLAVKKNRTAIKNVPPRFCQEVRRICFEEGENKD